MHCRKIHCPVDFSALHRFKPESYPVLLASNTCGEHNTRYSIILTHPEQTYRQIPGESLDCLESISVDLSQSNNTQDLPFIGGWFVYLSYEYAALVEPSVDLFFDQTTTPIAWVSRIPAAIIIDHQQDYCTLVTDEHHRHLLDRIEQDIEQAGTWQEKDLPPINIEEEDPSIYQQNLSTAHDYIVDGDIFQTNLSRLWQARSEQTIDPLSLYASLSRSNPAPFSAFARLDDSYILSSSPERLVSVRNGRAETRPIAGTHPRGDTAEQDQLLSENLLKHPKERAEHVMLIDLERNDLGRICKPGSIRMEERMSLESYSHVHHIVSSIAGDLQSDISLQQLIHAVFPGGTITGCPKVRCMEIISELERSPRGAYTGSLGYVSDDGQVDFNILIRTLTMQNNRISFRAGAGIVHDSISEKELHETRHKAKGLLNALQTDS